MPMVSVMLTKDEYVALQHYSQRLLRDPRAQALLIIREKMVSEGLLNDDSLESEETCKKV